MTDEEKNRILRIFSREYQVSFLGESAEKTEFSLESAEKGSLLLTAFSLPLYPASNDREVIEEIREYREEQADLRLSAMKKLSLLSVPEILPFEKGDFFERESEYYLYASRIFPNLTEIQNIDSDACIGAVCRALKICHANGIYHKYIVPSNIFFDSGKNRYFLGRINILDDVFTMKYDKIAESDNPLYDINMLAKAVCEINPPRQIKIVKKHINQYKNNKIYYHNADEILNDFRQKKKPALKKLILVASAFAVAGGIFTAVMLNKKSKVLRFTENKTIEQNKDMYYYDGYYYQYIACGSEGNLWENADSLCRQYDGKPVSVLSEEEQDFLYSVTKKYKEDFIWLGGYRDGSGKRKWTDGNVFDYENIKYVSENEDKNVHICLVNHGIEYEDINFSASYWCEISDDDLDSDFLKKASFGTVCKKRAFYGDADGNGIVNSSDVSLILQKIKNHSKISPNELYVCDVDGDGRLTNSDAAIIQGYTAKKSVGRDNDFSDFLKD